jgi:hypothetical protein
VAIAAIVLVMIWGGVHFLSVNRRKDAVLITAPKPAPVQPQVNPLELRQREAINAADKKRAAGDLAGASRALQDAASLNGPLNGEIQKKLDAIQAEMKDEKLRKLRQQEEQLWQSSKRDIDRGQFPTAEKYLNQILALSEGGLRKDDARKYLDQVIPQRKEEETSLAQAKRELQKKDRDSLNRAAALLDRIIQLEGPRKSEAGQLRQTVQDDLNTLQKQQRDQQIATLKASARLDAKQGNFSSARQKVGQIKQAGGDTTSLSAEIDQAEAAEQTRQQYEANYQQTVQKYKALAANDKNGMEAAHDSFLSIAQGGGSHANDARTYLSEINDRLTTPVAAPSPPPVARQDLPSAKAVDEAAVREVIKRYEQAFERRNVDALREIWPGIDKKRYDKYKDTFGSDITLHVQVLIEVRNMRVEISPDGQRAIITALRFQKTTTKDQTMSRQDKTVFQLGKTNGIWVISDVQ